MVRVRTVVLGLLFALVLLVVSVLPLGPNGFPWTSRGAAPGIEVAEANPAVAIARVVGQLLAKYGLRFQRFISSNVAALLQQGARAIQRSYVSIGKQIVLHEQKLANARVAAEAARRAYQSSPTRTNLDVLRKSDGLVRYYEGEIARFRTEHAILREAMQLTGISVP